MKELRGAILFVLFLLMGTPAVQGAQVLEIPGTGDSQLLLRKLADIYNARQDAVRIVIPDSIGSGGGIKSVGTGRSVIARVARKLKKKEYRYNLQYLQFASSPVVCAISANVQGVESISAGQLVGVYSGWHTKWSDLGGPAGNIYVINREPGDSSRQILDNDVPGFKEIHNSTGITSYSTPETVDLLDRHGNSIAYLPYSMTIGKKIKVLKYQGLNPTDNKYPLFTPFGMVWEGEIPQIAAGFLDFIFSKEGNRLMSEFGVVPVSRHP